jgi:LacI family transcriptional regulator
MAIINPDKLPTIIDVAREAGVSMKTVSRVINKDPTVRAENLEKVQKAIAKTGYRRNAFARGLRAKQSLVIGLLYEDAEGGYPSDILAGALSACRERGYHLMVEIVQGESMLTLARDFLLQMNFDGVILTPPVCDNPELLEFLDENDIRYARISPVNSLTSGYEIGINEELAGHALVRHLIGLGHRKIAQVRGDEGHRATIQRLSGYRRAHREAGLAVREDYVIEGGFSFEAGLEGARRLLALDDPPTAIFASNDEGAAGVLSYAHGLGVRVPDQLSVVGFDGSAIANLVHPTLTTMVQPTQELAAEAVRMIVDARTQTERKYLPFELRIGKSTAAISD